MKVMDDGVPVTGVLSETEGEDQAGEWQKDSYSYDNYSWDRAYLAQMGPMAQGSAGTCRPAGDLRVFPDQEKNNTPDRRNPRPIQPEFDRQINMHPC